MAENISVGTGRTLSDEANSSNSGEGIYALSQSDDISASPSINHEILCLFQKCNKLAAASYNFESKEMKILESSDNQHPDYTLVRIILTHLFPRLVLYNSSLPRELINLIKDEVHGEQTSFQPLKVKLFNYAICREKLFDTNFLNVVDRASYINSVLNAADERLVCVIGVLISYLKENVSTLMGHSTSELKITSVTTMSFENIVWIDNETFKSLQIFDSQQHPSAFKWNDKSNQEAHQEMSIYSIIEKHCCLLGTSRLRKFLAMPSKKIDVLLKRHEAIKFYRNPINQKTVNALKLQMNHLSPVELLKTNVGCSNVRGKHWKCIYQNIYYSVLFAETCKENSAHCFQEIANCLTDEMYAMAYHLDRIIDFQSMEDNEMFVVKSGVSDSLEKDWQMILQCQIRTNHPHIDPRKIDLEPDSQAKEKFSKLNSTINKVVPYEFDTVPTYVDKIHMLYVPEMKFLLSIPFWKKNLTKEELDLPGLEYKFTSNETAYYKSKRCYELDNILGDPQIEIMTEEANIIRALGKYINRHMQNTYDLIEKIGELDCIFALAAIADEYDYIEPNMINEKKISLISGVHPLLYIENTDFIPNTFESSPERSLVKVIYGPNASGKTVYLKQVALLTYLSHIGSFISAQEADVGICTQIRSQVSSTESIISECSYFMNDLRKLVDALNCATPSSLLILDEIGKGTTEINGIAIVASCLNYFIQLQNNSPHVLLSTHLTTVSDYIKPIKKYFSVQAMNYTIEDGKYVFLYSIQQEEGKSHISDLTPRPFSELPTPVATTANRVMFALQQGMFMMPYTKWRLQKFRRTRAFLRMFLKLEPNEEGVIEKLKRKLRLILK